MTEKIILDLDKADQSCNLSLTKDWLIDSGTEPIEPVLSKIESENCRTVLTDAQKVQKWDISLVNFLFHLHTFCKDKDIVLKLANIPAGAQSLLDLALSVPPREGAAHEDVKDSFIVSLGKKTLKLKEEFFLSTNFLGEVLLSLGRFLRCKASFSWRDLGGFIQQAGPNALTIVSLVSFLTGMILAFVGAIQLELFGAEMFVADLVGIAVFRTMGAIMAAIVMAGRTGAAFAAQLGTMQVNEEVDAFKTMGISPIDYLVLPRMIALILIMPMVCIYADIMGVLGGTFVGVFVLDFSLPQYFAQTIQAIRINDFWIGLFMSLVFGFIIAFSGCLRGINCGRSSASVGQATTSAVVTSIIWTVIATALITYLCSLLGI